MSQEHLLHTYNQLPIAFSHGSDGWLYDTSGKRYLDAFCGIAVTGLGHNHPVITKTIQEQAQKLLHISNLVEIPQQQALAEQLVNACGFDAKVFFSNSGAEAVETAIKLARLYGHSKDIVEPLIIVMTNAFHGRTMATISAGGSRKAQAGFEPLVQGFVRANYNDLKAITTIAETTPNVVALLMEPLQGEAGIRVLADDYLAQVREICTANNWLLMLDEIQTGMGRTGKLFAYQHTKITPDVITLAKGLANGIPIGATLVHNNYAKLFTPGSHGSTFGGNPLACAAGLATLTEIQQHKLWENAAKQGEKLLSGLRLALANHQHVVAVRGKGLMIGVELDRPCRDILKLALQHGIIFNIAQETTIRLLPPLTIGDQEVQMILDLIPKLITEFYQRQQIS